MFVVMAVFKSTLAPAQIAAGFCMVKVGLIPTTAVRVKVCKVQLVKATPNVGVVQSATGTVVGRLLSVMV